MQITKLQPHGAVRIIEALLQEASESMKLGASSPDRVGTRVLNTDIYYKEAGWRK